MQIRCKCPVKSFVPPVHSFSAATITVWPDSCLRRFIALARRQKTRHWKQFGPFSDAALHLGEATFPRSTLVTCFRWYLISDQIIAMKWAFHCGDAFRREITDFRWRLNCCLVVWPSGERSYFQHGRIKYFKNAVPCSSTSNLSRQQMLQQAWRWVWVDNFPVLIINLD